MSADVFRANLRHLQNNTLPAGWQLAAVQKWNGYGNSILKLAGTAAKEGLPVCVLTNQEAGDVVQSAAAAGADNLTIWRIMPADGPVKYADIYDAAKSGLDIVVSRLQPCNPQLNLQQQTAHCMRVGAQSPRWKPSRPLQVSCADASLPAMCHTPSLHTTQELMSPLNQRDILAAAKAASKVIPVQIYLFSHYDGKYGYNFKSSQQLQDLVKTLDPKLVRVVGGLVGGLLKLGG